MKIKERKPAQNEGFGAHPALVRVFELPDDSTVPDGAEKVSDDTPVSDWHPEEG